MLGRLVITGAGGQLGGVLAAQASEKGSDQGSEKGSDVLALTSSQWDITDPEAAERIVRKGDVVINCAAYTNVDGAESDESRAHAVNVTGPGHIARACARAGARLIHVSTDYVFGGDPAAPRRPYEPSDPTAPLGVYGHTKHAGELAVLDAMPEAVVVRTAWVYTGGTGRDFVAVMRRLAAGDGPVEVVDDQCGSPTYVVDLAAALLEVAGAGVSGPILHAANGGETSRFEQARAVFELCGADPERVQPVPTTKNPRPAPRPGYSALGSRESAEHGLTPLRPWRSALVAALAAANLDA
jgi:dTDP-4-dehydrorhamnose reductase